MIENRFLHPDLGLKKELRVFGNLIEHGHLLFRKTAERLEIQSLPGRLKEVSAGSQELIEGLAGFRMIGQPIHRLRRRFRGKQRRLGKSPFLDAGRVFQFTDGGAAIGFGRRFEFHRSTHREPKIEKEWEPKMDTAIC